MSLKQKATSGIIWSFVDNLSRQGIVFIFGIILARLLTPYEFGLIGMTAIFLALSEGFVDSGFGQALIRKKECTDEDYSTVFYYNLLVSILLYVILFFSAGLISDFYNKPELKLLVRILSLGLLIKAFSLIQLIILIKAINFKLQTKITIISSLTSGIFGILLAYHGYGVWSLVFKMLLSFTITSLLLWILNSWKPKLVFSMKSFKELFSFGYKLLLSGSLNKIYKNIFYVIIGKYFTATDLGYYTKADQFNAIASENITIVFQRVSFPLLATIQDDISRLRLTYSKIIKSIMIIVFCLLIGMASMSDNIILLLLGERWLPSAVYLQLLCFVGIFQPLQAINQNILKVLGFSGIVLKLDIIKKIIVIPVILVGIFYGIKIMIFGMILHALVAYLIDSYYSGKFINYPTQQQIRDILPSFTIALVTGIFVYLIGAYLKTTLLIDFSIQFFSYLFSAIVLFEIFKVNQYLMLKEMAFKYFKTLKR